jgi:hypothetical protein
MPWPAACACHRDARDLSTLNGTERQHHRAQCRTARTQTSLDGEFAKSRGPEPLGSVTPNVSKMLLLPRAVLLLLPPALRAAGAATAKVRQQATVHARANLKLQLRAVHRRDRDERVHARVGGGDGTTARRWTHMSSV